MTVLSSLMKLDVAAKITLANLAMLAMKGESAVDHRWLHRGTRISAIAAMTTTGILAVDLMKGSVNGDRFFDYVRGSLIPEMLPFDGRNPKSIAVMDN